MQGPWVQSLVRELDPLGPIKSSHATTKSLHAATYYCCTWKFVPFEQHLPIASSSWQRPIYSLFLGSWFYFLDFTYKRDHALFVFLWLILLRTTPSSPIHVVSQAGFPSFYGWIIFHCISCPDKFGYISQTLILPPLPMYLPALCFSYHIGRTTIKRFIANSEGPTASLPTG